MNFVEKVPKVADADDDLKDEMPQRFGNLLN